MSDAVIIGAGPAGCIAAILLARGEWHTSLIEQHRFPRDKVCGECLSATGFDVLTRLGLATQFQSLSPMPLRHALIHSRDGNAVDILLTKPMWGLSRSRLDQWLLDEARRAGVIVLQPARCEQITPQLVVRDLLTNESRQMNATHILLADGKGALMKSRPNPTNDLGVKAHFTKITGPRDAIELFGVNGHYGGIAAIEEARWNVAFSVPQSRVRTAEGNLDRVFGEIVLENHSLVERFREAQRVGPWHVSPLPRFAVTDRWPKDVIPLGNAAAAVEPIGGEGMGLAMRSAELAATMLLSGKFDATELRRAFRRLWSTRSIACRAAAVAMSMPRVANWMTPMLRRMPSIPRAMMSLMGK